MDGEQIKLDRLLAIQERGIEHNAIALALPPYRKIVRVVTSALIPRIYEYIEVAQSKRGRPGKNLAGISYIKNVGVEKCCALAVSSLVNNFARPISYQSMVGKIGQSIAYEWGILQEDPDVIAHINRSMHKGSVTSRRYIYLAQYIKKKFGRPIQYVPAIARSCIGDLFLSHMIQIKNLLQTQRIKTGRNKSQTLVIAHTNLIEFIQDALRTTAHKDPVLLPHLEPIPADPVTLIKPQRGKHLPESTTSKDSLLVKTADRLNHVGFRVNVPQLEFIQELSRMGSATLGLPGHRRPELAPYLEGASAEQIQNVKASRAKTYADRALWQSKRTALLSHVGILQEYKHKEVFFEVEADFRGRLYPTANVLSYQGPDWIRSVWKFSKGEEIHEENERWLFIHAANCFGLSRLPYHHRVGRMRGLVDQMRTLVENPHENIGFLEQAKEPFRFLAAAREIVEYLDHGPGYVSHIPVFIDASAQGIQIYAALLWDMDLMLASNVVATDAVPHDIYQELADQINEDARIISAPEAAWVRTHPVDRGIAKRIMMLIPYGGRLHSAFKITREIPGIPAASSVWLAKILYNSAVDILDSMVKFQYSAAQAVIEQTKERETASYSWESPAGVSVTQTYTKHKTVRIQTAIKGHLYSYRTDKKTPEYRKLGAAFIPNFTHSIDASILCHSVVYSCALQDSKDTRPICTIHDSIGVLAAHVDQMQTQLAGSFIWSINKMHDELSRLKIPIPGKPKFLGESGQGPLLGTDVYSGDQVGLSDYLFS